MALLEQWWMLYDQVPKVQHICKESDETNGPKGYKL